MKTARQVIGWLLAPLVALLALLGRLYEEYKFARRFTLHWSQALITFNVVMVWANLHVIKDMKTAEQFFVYLGAINLLLGISIGLYQWDAARDKDK
jgi:predicted membrane channel-forming protein YqfA (hemolysin III family)